MTGSEQAMTEKAVADLLAELREDFTEAGVRQWLMSAILVHREWREQSAVAS